MSNLLIATLSSWICMLCSAAPRILKLRQFETIHMEYRAINMDCEWIGACYVHKSMPLELSDHKKKMRGWIFLWYIYQPIRHIFKLAEHFGSVWQSDWTKTARSRVQFSISQMSNRFPFGHFWLHVPGLARGLVLWTRSTFEKHWFKTTPANISVPQTETGVCILKT